MSATRVMLVIPTLDQSGAEKQFTLLATGLPRDQFEVQAIALTRGGPYAEVLSRHGIPLKILKKRWKFDPFCLRRLAREIREFQPDIIHTWLFAANSYARMVAGGLGQPPVIVSERCVDSWKSGWQLKLDRWQIPRTARLVGNSNSVANFYREKNFPDERIRVVPNGIELPPVSPLTELERARARMELMGVPHDAKVVGYIGRLARQKRLLDLIWATILLRDVDSKFRLVLIGDGPERPALERMVRDLHLEQHILFLGHQDNTAQFLPLMDVFALASDFEGMSNSIMEAMAAGLPVIASDIAPNRELVFDGVTGFLFPVGDRAACARACLFLFEHPERAHKLGLAGRQRMEYEFSVPKMVERYAEVYREVLSQKK